MCVLIKSYCRKFALVNLKFIPFENKKGRGRPNVESYHPVATYILCIGVE